MKYFGYFYPCELMETIYVVPNYTRYYMLIILSSSTLCPNLGPPLLITKSNKHKLSLDTTKLNRINECTIITLLCTDDAAKQENSNSQVSY